jgi:hypothetical protein
MSSRTAASLEPGESRAFPRAATEALAGLPPAMQCPARPTARSSLPRASSSGRSILDGRVDAHLKPNRSRPKGIRAEPRRPPLLGRFLVGVGLAGRCAEGGGGDFAEQASSPACAPLDVAGGEVAKGRVVHRHPHSGGAEDVLDGDAMAWRAPSAARLGQLWRPPKASPAAHPLGDL